jgi:hypothetical protein
MRHSMALGSRHIGVPLFSMQVKPLVPFFRVCMAPFTMRTIVASCTICGGAAVITVAVYSKSVAVAGWASALPATTTSGRPIARFTNR